MKAPHSSLETLEPRIAPAAVFVDATSLTVALKGSTLNITPATANAAVDLIVEQLPNGDFLISDGTGDDDLEETADFTGNVTSLKIVLGSGDDTVEVALRGDQPFGGAISIATGAGEDTVNIVEGSAKGALSVVSTGPAAVQIGGFGTPVKFKGAVSVTQVGGSFELGEGATSGALMASGADSFTLAGSVLGSATLKTTSAGAEFLIGTDAPAPRAFVQGALTVTAATGDDVLDLAQVLIGGALNVTLGAGDDTVTAGAGTVITGAAKFNAGNGLNSVTLGSGANAGPTFLGATTVAFAKAASGSSLTVESGTFAKAFTFTGSAGDDTVTLGVAGTAGPAFYDKVSLTLGKAAALNTLDIRSGTLALGATVKGDAGNDDITVGADAVLFGALSIAAGNGTNHVNLGTLSGLSSFGYKGGTGVDTVAIASLGGGHALGVVSLGAGNDAFTLAPTAGPLLAAFKVDGGSGTDTVTAPPALLSDDLLLAGIETIL